MTTLMRTWFGCSRRPDRARPYGRRGSRQPSSAKPSYPSQSSNDRPEILS